MANNFDFLFKQVRDQIAGQIAPAPANINPTFATTQVNRFQNAEALPASNNNASFPWAVRAGKVVLNTNPGLLDDNTFLNLGIPLDSYSIDSANGNLTVANLTPGKIYSFSANIQRYSLPVSVNINIPWSSNLTILLNGNSVLSSTGNTTSSVTLNLNQGANTLTIYLFPDNNNTFFTINNNLGNFADQWSIPSFNQSSVPTNVSVTNDTSQSQANVFTNVLGWDLANDGFTYGDRTYRRGPYNPLINFGPVLSGSYVNSGSLAANTNYYYQVAAYGSAGESLPIILSGIRTQSLDPNLSNFFLSGYATVGALGTGVYYYGLSLWGPVGTETQAIGTISGLATPYTSNNITWTISSNTISTFYNWAPSGYKLFRDTSGVFNSSSLLTIITGIDTTSFVDTGLATTLGAPLAVSQAFSGIGINLSWGATNNANTSGYYVYRSTNPYFGSNSRIATLVGVRTSFFDSGYALSSGSPISFQHFNDVTYPTNSYRDVGVRQGQQYDYAVSSINSLFIESQLSSPVSIVAGGSIPPNPPSGIFVTTSDAYASLSWQNGLEPDLVGTKVYYSSSLGGTYLQIGDTKSTVFTKYLGYNTTAFFKLANYNFSSALSALTTGVTGTTNAAPIPSGSIAPTYTWTVNFSKNPSNAGTETISILSPIAVQGTPTITVQQLGQGSPSFVVPITGSSPNFSGFYTVVGGFDGPATVLASGVATNSGVILGSATLNVLTVGPQNPTITINGGNPYSKTRTNTVSFTNQPNSQNVSKMFLSQTYPSYTGLIAQYRFEQNLFDSTSNQYNLSQGNSSSSVPYGPGFEGSSSVGPFIPAPFLSPKSYLTAPAPLKSALSGMSSFVISGNFFPLDNGAYTMLGYTNNNNTLVIASQNSGVKILVPGNTTLTVTGVATGVWHQFNVALNNGTMSLIVDSLPASVSPNTFMFTNSGTTTLTLGSDTVGNSNFYGYLDNVNIFTTGTMSGFIPYSTYTSWTFPGDGPNFVYGQLQDVAGNLSPIASGNILIDTSSPLISGTYPPDGSLLSSSTNLISGWLFDANSKIDASSIRVVVDGTDYSNSLTKFGVDANTTGFYITSSPVLLDGQHQVSIDGSDFAGNKAHKDYVFTTLGTVPAQPTNLTAIGLYNAISLSWDRVIDQNLNYYELQVSGFPFSTGFNNLVSWTDVGSQFSVQSGTTIDKTNFFVHSNLEGNIAQKSGVNLTYRVRAVNTVLTSGQWSSTSSATSTIVNSGDIAANSIYANKIQAGEIYTKLLQTNEFKADVIKAGTLNTDLVTISGSAGSVIINSTGITISNGKLTVIGNNGQTAVSGSTITTSNLNISNMSILTTTDVDMDYFLGMENLLPGVTPQYGKIYSCLASGGGSSIGNPFITAYFDYNNASSSIGTLRVVSQNGTNFSSVPTIYQTAISGGIALNNYPFYDCSAIDAIKSGSSNFFKMNIAYLSGSKLLLDNYQINESISPFVFYKAGILNGTGLSGISIFNGSFQSLGPKIAYNPLYPDNQIVIYLTGVINTIPSSPQTPIGLFSVNQNGLQSGQLYFDTTTKMTSVGVNSLDCCMDSAGNTHLFTLGYFGGSSTSGIQWTKYNVNGSGMSILSTGVLFPNTFNSLFTYQWNGIKCAYDENDNINLLATSNQYTDNVTYGTTLYYGKIDTSGNVLCNLTPVYTVPFSLESYNIAYNASGNYGFSVYNLSPGGAATNSSYQYLPGVYRRRHIMKDFPISSMYQILQSIVK